MRQGGKARPPPTGPCAACVWEGCGFQGWYLPSSGVYSTSCPSSALASGPESLPWHPCCHTRDGEDGAQDVAMLPLATVS